MDMVAYESVPLIKGLRVLCLWSGEDVDSSTLGEVFIPGRSGRVIRLIRDCVRR